MCGLAGMQTGVFKMLATRGLSDAYLKIRDEISDVDPREWDEQMIRQKVRPTRRCMLEVY
jgi:hypothetical protein